MSQMKHFDILSVMSTKADLMQKENITNRLGGTLKGKCLSVTFPTILMTL